MTTKKLTLQEFAKTKERADCIACVLPEREEIDEAYRSGITRKIILQWLWEVKGYDAKSVFDETGAPKGISSTMLDKHLTGQHHFKGN